MSCVRVLKEEVSSTTGALNLLDAPEVFVLSDRFVLISIKIRLKYTLQHIIMLRTII